MKEEKILKSHNKVRAPKRNHVWQINSERRKLKRRKRKRFDVSSWNINKQETWYIGLWLPAIFLSHGTTESRSAGGSTRQQDQSVKAENLIDRTHNSLKAERYLCRISMQMTFNIFQIYFMAACHTNICYPIHLAATLFQPTRRRCRVRMWGCFCLRCGFFWWKMWHKRSNQTNIS